MLKILGSLLMKCEYWKPNVAKKEGIFFPQFFGRINEAPELTKYTIEETQYAYVCDRGIGIES